MKCCGGELGVSAKFCSNCGKKVMTTEQQIEELKGVVANLTEQFSELKDKKVVHIPERSREKNTVHEQDVIDAINNGAKNNLEVLKALGLRKSERILKNVGTATWRLGKEGRINKEEVGWYRLSKTGMKYKTETKKEKKPTNPNDKRIARASFMASRANGLMRQFPQWSREKAFVQASTEWNTKKKQTKEQREFKPIENFPAVIDSRISNLDTKDMNNFLAQMVKNIIADGSSLKLFPDGQGLGIEDGRNWHEFVGRFMVKSKEISEYFNASGKFKVEIFGNNYEKIVYVR